MLDASEAFAAKLNKSDLESLRSRLTALTCRFSQHLATQGRACLAQIWVPDAEQDGSVTLHTQVRRYSPCQRRSPHDWNHTQLLAGAAVDCARKSTSAALH